MSKPKKTKAPDYTALANQQAALAKQNWKDQTVAMRPDQTGPEGSRTWEQDPQGNWSEAISMAPERQAIWDTLQRKTGEQLGGLDTSQVDFSGAPDMPTVGGYNEQAMNTVRALQAPDLERRANADRARRTAMGLGEASGTAWNTGEQNLNDAASRADMQAILAGINQGNIQFGQGMDLHKQGISNITGERTLNANLAGGMMGLGNNFRLPTFANAPTPGMPGAATPDLMGSAEQQYQAKLAQNNASSAWKDKLLGTAGSIAGSFFGPAGAMIGGKLASGLGGMMGGGGPEQLGGTNY
jgi:hypothetical protein